jgi:hypothetical protein
MADTTVEARVVIRVPASGTDPAAHAEQVVRAALRRVGEVVAFHVEAVGGQPRELG